MARGQHVAKTDNRLVKVLVVLCVVLILVASILVCIWFWTGGQAEHRNSSRQLSSKQSDDEGGVKPSLGDDEEGTIESENTQPGDSYENDSETQYVNENIPMEKLYEMVAGSASDTDW